MSNSNSALDVKEYCKDPSSEPDKAESWPYGVEKDWITLSHGSLRGELEEITLALKAILGDKKGAKDEIIAAWKLQSLERIWKYHDDHAQKHHKVEKEVLEPFMAEKIKFEKV